MKDCNIICQWQQKIIFGIVIALFILVGIGIVFNISISLFPQTKPAITSFVEKIKSVF